MGKTADTAMLVYEQVKALEAAGAFAAELEVVPDRVAAEISRRTSLLMLSMGAGTGGDAQYLFAEDVLGYTRGRRPRHAKVYRDFRTELDRLQGERVAAFREFAADVASGAYPAPEHLVPIDDAEFAAFLRRLPERDLGAPAGYRSQLKKAMRVKKVYSDSNAMIATKTRSAIGGTMMA